MDQTAPIFRIFPQAWKEIFWILDGANQRPQPSRERMGGRDDDAKSRRIGRNRVFFFLAKLGLQLFDPIPFFPPLSTMYKNFSWNDWIILVERFDDPLYLVYNSVSIPIP